MPLRALLYMTYVCFTDDNDKTVTKKLDTSCQRDGRKEILRKTDHGMLCWDQAN